MKRKVLLPAPPRTLAPGLGRRLWWGTALTVFGMSTITLVWVATLFMFLLYEIPSSALISSDREVVKVESQIIRKEKETLPAGDRVSVVWAPVRVNETVIEAKGYGSAAETAQIGDNVEIWVPKNEPSAATLHGFQAYPVRPHTLLVFAVLFMAPGLLSILWAWSRARRSRFLLTEGLECQGDRLKTIPLPRPLKDMAVVKWEYSVEGADGRIWALQNADWKNPPLLVAKSKAALLNNLLSSPVVQDEQVDDESRLSRFFAGVNAALLLLCLFTLLVFFLF
jgi:hypothetical protein